MLYTTGCLKKCFHVWEAITAPQWPQMVEKEKIQCSSKRELSKINLHSLVSRDIFGGVKASQTWKLFLKTPYMLHHVILWSILLALKTIKALQALHRVSVLGKVSRLNKYIYLNIVITYKYYLLILAYNIRGWGWKLQHIYTF